MKIGSSATTCGGDRVAHAPSRVGFGALAETVFDESQRRWLSRDLKSARNCRRGRRQQHARARALPNRFDAAPRERRSRFIGLDFWRPPGKLPRVYFPNTIHQRPRYSSSHETHVVTPFLSRPPRRAALCAGTASRSASPRRAQVHGRAVRHRRSSGAEARSLPPGETRRAAASLDSRRRLARREQGESARPRDGR